MGVGGAIVFGGGGGSGDVTAAANLTDNYLLRGDGGAKGIQTSGVACDDSDNITGVNSLTVDTLVITTVYENETFEDNITFEKNIILTKAPATDHNASAIIITATAGENLAQNQLVYMKSDGKCWLAKADAVTTLPVIGMATASISANAAGNIMLFGAFRDDSWSWTVGGLLYLSAATGGLITQSAPAATGNQVQIVGIAMSATVIFLRPDFTYVEVA